MQLNYRFTMLLFTFLVLGVSQTYAQSWEFDVNFMTGFPQNEFGDNVDNVGLGGGGGFGYHLGPSPIMVGGEFSFLSLGSETRRVLEITNIQPNITVDVKASSYIFLGHFFVRLQSNQGGFRPYLEGLIGFHDLITETTGIELISENTNRTDFAFSYGTGAGVMIRVKKTDKKIKEAFEAFVNFRVRYLFGSEADYLVFRRENGQVSMTFFDAGDFNNSRTDLITFQLGMAFTF